MKTISSIFHFSIFAISCAFGHGIDGHVFREEDKHPNETQAAEVPSSGKSFKDPVVTETSPRWGASIETGWTSREMHYGVDETGNYGAYITELSLRIGRLNLGVWSGFGVGNDFQEWDFSAAYNFEIGSVFFVPGYNFRYMPGIVEGGSEGAHEGHDHHDHHEDHEGETSGGHANHLHKAYGHELFFVLGTTAIKYVTPSMNFVWDLSNTPGVYMDFRLDGDIPVYRDVVSLHPYALLSLNMGYTTRQYYGWNNFQFGLEAVCKLSRNISLVAGVDYSVAMTALRSVGQDNVVWANTSVRFDF